MMKSFIMLTLLLLMLREVPVNGDAALQVFRGGFYTWKPYDDNSVLNYHRLSFINSDVVHSCNFEDINEKIVQQSGKNLSYVLNNGFTGDISNSDTYLCLEFNNEENWLTGGSYNQMTGFKDNPKVQIGYIRKSWIELTYGGGNDVNLLTKVDITKRKDSKTRNSPPIFGIQPIVKLKRGCSHQIQIPVTDVDNDNVKCRFAYANESGSILNSFPGGEMDEENCIISYNAIDVVGLYAVAVQIEDFGYAEEPFSSVAVQFIVEVVDSSDGCQERPFFSPDTPKEGSCNYVDVNGTFAFQVAASTGKSGPDQDIKSFYATLLPSITQSGVSRIADTQVPVTWTNNEWYSANFTWTPENIFEMGVNFFCVYAHSQSSSSSENRCFQLFYGDPAATIISTNYYSVLDKDDGIFMLNFNQTVEPSEEFGHILINNESYHLRNPAVQLIDNNRTLVLDLNNVAGLSLNESEVYELKLPANFVKSAILCGTTNEESMTFTFKVITNTTYLSYKPKKPEIVMGANGAKSAARFSTSLKDILLGPFAVYTITWYIAGSTSILKTTKGFNSTYEGSFAYGDQLYVKVELQYVNSDTTIELTRSELFNTGLKVTPDNIALVEGGKPQYITISFDGEFICYNQNESCYVDVQVDQNDNANIFLSHCTLRFEGPSSKQLAVYPTEDFVSDGNQILQFLLTYSPVNLEYDWESKGKLIRVEVEDRPTLKCSSTGDPHITTFDQNKIYDLHHQGDFMMVHSKINNFQVNARTYKCNGNIACNCGVAVSENDDTIIMDRCSGKLDIRFAMKYSPHPDTILYRVSANKYRIKFPSGVLITITLGSSDKYIGIFISLPPLYYNKTQGLCGTADGNAGNDLIGRSSGNIYTMKRHPDDEYLLSWRLDMDESLFHKKVGPVQLCREEVVKGENDTFCQCGMNNGLNDVPAKCTFNSNVARPLVKYAKRVVPAAFRDCVPTIDIVIPNSLDENIKPHPVIDTPFVKPTWPTASGINEARALLFCRNALESDLGNKCLELLGDDLHFDELIEECKSDILLSDSTLFKDSILSVLETKCEEALIENATVYQRSSLIFTRNQEYVYLPISTLTCLNSCSGQGTCNGNVECDCTGGFTGEDCSVANGSVTLMHDSLILCDIHSEDCNFISLTASHVGTSSPEAEIEVYDLDIDGTNRLHSKTRNSICSSLANNEFSCPATAARMNNENKTIILLSIVLNSSPNRTEVVVYDSKCLKCNATTGSCQRREKGTSQDVDVKIQTDACLINDRCYAAGELNPNNETEICNPFFDPDSFYFQNFTCEFMNNMYVNKIYTEAGGVDNDKVTTKFPILTTVTESYRSCELYCYVYKYKHHEINAISMHVKDGRVSCECHMNVYELKEYVQDWKSCLFPPISDDAPYIEKPVLEIVTNSSDEFYGSFKCSWNDSNAGNKTSYRFLYAMEPSNQLVEEVFVENRAAFSYLDQARIQCQGVKIFCSAESWTTQATPDSGYFARSHAMRSDSFFSGMQVTPNEIDFSEGDAPVQLNVTMTIPIVCRNRSESCNVTMKLVQDKNDVTLDQCTFTFGEGHPEFYLVNVYAKRDELDDGDQKVILTKELLSAHNVVNFTCYEDHDPTEIMVRDKRSSKCITSGDPHIRTFDARKVYYDLHHAGDFLMAESSLNSMKIHTRTYKCNGAIACNCGVAVQENEDILVINRCNGKMKFRFPMMKSPREGTKLLKIKKNEYKMTFASGLYINVITWGRKSINVYITLPSQYYNTSHGLCGTNDGDPTNDLISKEGESFPHKKHPARKFLLSWKVPQNESLFQKSVEGARQCRMENNVTRNRQHCTCGKGDKETCVDKLSTTKPSYNKKVKEIMPEAFKDCVNITAPIVVPEEPTGEPYDPPTGVIVFPPTPSENETKRIEQLCEDGIGKSNIVETCKNLLGPDFDVRTFLEECKDDIMLTGNEDFIKTTLATLTAECVDTILTKPNTWENTTNGEFKPPTQISNLLCPNNCNGNGICSDGDCTCKSAYESSDCSVVAGMAPNITDPIKICDRKRQNCDRVSIDGSGFSDTGKKICRITVLEFFLDESYGKTSNYTVVGEVLSDEQIICLIPPQVDRTSSRTGVSIEISNNGVDFSDEHLCFSYDTGCYSQRCDQSTGICPRKNGTCIIDNKCYKKNDVNPENPLEICDPEQDPDNFVASWECLLQCRNNELTFQVNPNAISNKYNMQFFFEANHSCQGHINDTNISIRSGLQHCGIALLETPQYLLYNATVVLSSVNGDGVITRGHSIRYHLNCRYDRVYNTSIGTFKSVDEIENKIKDVHDTLKVDIEIMEPPTHTRPYPVSSYPLVVDSFERLYFAIDLIAASPVFKLVVQNCYASPSSDGHSAIKHDVIEDRCPSDNTFLSDEANSHQKRFQFSIEAFSFLQNTSGAYMHCGVLVCKQSSRDPKCSFGCQEKRRRKDVQLVSDDEEAPDYLTVTSGYVTILTKDVEGGGLQKGTEDLQQNSETSQEEKPSFFNQTTNQVLMGVIIFVLVSLFTLLLYRTVRGDHGQTRAGDRMKTTEAGVTNDVFEMN